MKNYPNRAKAPANVLGEHTVAQPMPITDVVITGGRMAHWQNINLQATIPHCIDNLETSGVMDNLRRVVGESGSDFEGFWFSDSDLYKVIEAVGWEIARTGTTQFDDWLDTSIGLTGRVQDESGYVMSWIQGVAPEKKFNELDWTHEMYVLGHMIQAGIALDRASGRSDLLQQARAFADLVNRRFGPGREDGICGHPGLETALVELYRHTGEVSYLLLAEKMINLRGQGTLKVGVMGASYFQDHLPVRESLSAQGHAVRQLYLNAGVTDLFMERGEEALLAAMDGQWESAHQRKMYVSGAFGSRHRDEAFGEDYELPSDRAYAETCATIADLFWTWRMILAGGAAGAGVYADVMEREIYNALSASIDNTGTKFFYSNPLQLRPDKLSQHSAPRERTHWYECACCPPNIARTIAQISGMLTSFDDDCLWIHQIVPARVKIPGQLGGGELEIVTDYPTTGEVAIRVRDNTNDQALLRVRIPSWIDPGTISTNDGQVRDGYWVLPLSKSADAKMEFPIEARYTFAHPKADALRGSAVIERGPVLYCLEDTDLSDDIDLDLLYLTGKPPKEVGDGSLLVEVGKLNSDATLYSTSRPTVGDDSITVRFIPFADWGNRGARSMRVWLPYCEK